MEPEEVTTDNWVEKLAEFLNPEQAPLSCSVREHMSIEGQSAMRSLRDQLPAFSVTVATVEEE